MGIEFGHENDFQELDPAGHTRVIFTVNAHQGELALEMGTKEIGES